MSDPTAPEVEATGADTIDVAYKGITYTFPADIASYDGDLLDAIDDEKFSHALRSLLDAEQWAKFKATKPTVGDYGALLDAWADAAGHRSSGESPASAASS